MDPLEVGIDCVNKFDFTKGFSCFHVVWPLESISKPMRSPAFKTTVSTGDGTTSFTWYLCVGPDSSGNPEDTFLGLCLQARTTDDMFPVVYQISLSSAATKKSLMKSCSIFHVLRSNKGAAISKSAAEMATHPDGKMVFHCWIDIPNTVVTHSSNRKRKREAAEDSSDASTCSEFRRRNIDLFMIDIAKQFPAVVNGEDGCITLAIMKDGQVVRRFLCHRNNLSARSPVFERLFAGKEWKENAENGERLIEIEDIDETAMEMILNHIYTAYLPDKSATVDQLLDLIYAADKYNLSSLKDWCAQFLIVAYSLDSLERIRQLEVADRHGLDQLKAVCIAQLSMNIEGWESQEDRDNIPPYLLSEIITALKERQCGTEQIVLASG